MILSVKKLLCKRRSTRLFFYRAGNGFGTALCGMLALEQSLADAPHELVFLGGSFYSIDMLPPLWQKLSLFNPVVYLISGFRWSFYGTADVGVGISLAMTFVFMLLCLGAITWIFRTGYKLKA